MFLQEIIAIWPLVLGGFLIGYFLGAIPFGLLLTRLFGAGDLRSVGSGNIGATNVLRTGRKGLAAATLLLDALKGMLPVMFVYAQAGKWPALAAGLGAFLGHCFPIWLGFKGGKGVATYVGVLAALSFKGLLVFAVVWLGIAAVTRFSSLAALLASVAVPAALLWMEKFQIAGLFILLSLLVWVFHRTNISRLLSGSESRIGNKG